MKKPKRILLTGATGRLGSVVCRKLHEDKFEVIATDQNLNKPLPVKVKVADLRERIPCYELLDGVDAVVHLAAHPNDHNPIKQDLLNENLSITMNLIHAAYECGISKFIYSSSIQAMSHERRIGDRGKIPPSKLEYLPADGNLPAIPGNTYALSKKLCEEMLKYYSQEFGFSCIAIRFPYLFNPEHKRYYRRYTKSQIKTFQYFRNLDECFTSLSMNDGARLISKILKSKLPGYRCYFPACEAPLSDEKIEVLIKKYYKGAELKKPLPEIKSLVDISRITDETGWVPKDNVFKIIRDATK